MAIPSVQAYPAQPISARAVPRVLIVVGVALLATVLVVAHCPGINGPWYWKWNWRHLPAAFWFSGMLSAALPFALGQFVYGRFPSRRGAICALILLMVSGVAMRMVYSIAQDEQFGLTRLAAIIRGPLSVSYYADAEALSQADHWLVTYPEILPATHLHTRSKPPGPVAWYMAWIRAMGYGNRSAIAAAIGVAVVTVLAIPLVFLSVRELTGDTDAGFAAASVLSLSPGFVLVYPMLDPVFACFTCAILFFWHRAMIRASAGAAVMCGIAIGGGTFFTYTPLTLGLFMALYAWLIARPARPAVTFLKASCCVLGGVVVFYGILWSFTWFDPIATFRVAWRNQHELLHENAIDRPYPWTILFDLTDFALGLGWVGVCLAIMPLARWRQLSPRMKGLILLCLLQPALIAVAGLMQSETARVWNFMLPLVLVPAGLELARWPAWARNAVFVSLMMVLLAIGQNMAFVNP